MRKVLFWSGCVMLFLIPIAFTIEILWQQDMPAVQPWKWALLAGTVLLIYFSRDRDTVLHHHVIEPRRPF